MLELHTYKFDRKILIDERQIQYAYPKIGKSYDVGMFEEQTVIGLEHKEFAVKESVRDIKSKLVERGVEL